MGRYVTPAGVVIEMSDKAAQAIGYKAEAPAESEKPAPKPRAKRAAAKK